MNMETKKTWPTLVLALLMVGSVLALFWITIESKKEQIAVAQKVKIEDSPEQEPSKKETKKGPEDEDEQSETPANELAATEEASPSVRVVALLGSDTVTLEIQQGSVPQDVEVITAHSSVIVSCGEQGPYVVKPVTIGKLSISFGGAELVGGNTMQLRTATGGTISVTLGRGKGGAPLQGPFPEQTGPTVEEPFQKDQEIKIVE